MLNKKKTHSLMDVEQKSALVASWLKDKKGADIRALDVRGLCSITDYLVIVTANGARHAKALADHVNDMCASENIEYMGLEGYQTGDWVLVDLNDIIVHIFQEETRAFYDIEGLWAEGKTIDFSELKAKKPSED